MKEKDHFPYHVWFANGLILGTQLREVIMQVVECLAGVTDAKDAKKVKYE